MGIYLQKNHTVEGGALVGEGAPVRSNRVEFFKINQPLPGCLVDERSKKWTAVIFSEIRSFFSKNQVADASCPFNDCAFNTTYL